MKRSNQSVPSKETGAIPADFNRSQSIKWQNKGGRNATTNEAMHGSGIAPRPRAAKQELIASSSATASPQAHLARVPNAHSSPTGRSGPAGSFTPVQNNAMANQVGSSASYGGQGTPPAPGGGPPGLRAGGRNQMWPNAGSGMYTDAAKIGSSGKDSGPIGTRKPARRGKGAAFYGEYP